MPARIALAFSIIIGGATLAVMLVEGVALRSTHHLKNAVEHYSPVAVTAAEFEREVLNARVHFIYYLTIQKPGSFEQGKQRFELAKEKLRGLQKIVGKNGTESEFAPGVAALSEGIDRYEAEMNAASKSIDQGLRSGPAYEQTVKSWAGAGATLVQVAAQLQNTAKEKTLQTQNEAASDLHLVILLGLAIMGFGSAMGIAIACVATRTIARDLKATARQLDSGARQVTAVASQMAASSHSMAHGAARQTELLRSTTSATERVNLISHKNSDRAHDAHNGTNSVSADTDHALQKLDAMSDSMTSIVESSKRISQVATAIDGIAFQTNILALNAAVEAARAGENGSGFAVVADEVRRLAQRSSEAARETQELVEGSIGRSNEGTERLRQLSESIRAISKNVGQVHGLVQEVSDSSQEQVKAVLDVTEAVAEIRQLTSQSTAESQQSAAAGSELETQAEALTTLVANLGALVGRKNFFVTQSGV